MMRDAHPLIEKYLTGTLQPAEAAAFREWLDADEDNLRQFILETYLDRGVFDILNSEQIRNQLEHPDGVPGDQKRPLTNDREIKEPAPPSASHEDTALLGLLKYDSSEARKQAIESYANQQLEAFLREQQHLFQEQPALKPRLVRLTLDWRQALNRITTWGRWTYKSAVALAAVLLLTIFLAAGIKKWRDRGITETHESVVAKLNASLEAHWTIPPADPNLRPGKLSLERGWAQLSFLNGTDVILQAPCLLELESKESMFLTSGSATAHITSSKANGFTIHTPQSKIVDLGTEFGVHVDSHGSFEVHVFDGAVQLGTINRNAGKDTLRKLSTGRAAWIDRKGTLQTESLSRRTSLFYRELPEVLPFGIPGERLDLTDLLNQGNGFGTSMSVLTVDPSSGRMSGHTQGRIRTNPHRYVTLNWHRFIDGVFIPDGDGGTVTVSSTGHRFEGCPDTDGQAWTGISSDNMIRHTDEERYPLELAGSEDSNSPPPMISMHANAGITFDLDAIRQTIPAVQIKAFSAKIGISTHAPNKIAKSPSRADFWILANGELLHSSTGLTKGSAAEINITLQTQQRFLTLMTTDGGNSFHQDHCLFVAPILELGPIYKGTDNEKK